MERERLTRILEQPGNVAREDLVGLKAMTDRYPWFSGAQLLLAIGEHEAGDVLFDGTLETSSTHIPNREVLFDLLETDGSRGLNSEPSVENESTVDGTLVRVPQAKVQEPSPTDHIVEVQVESANTTVSSEPPSKAREEDLLDQLMNEAAIASGYDLTWSKNAGSTETRDTREEVDPPQLEFDDVEKAISTEIEDATPLASVTATDVSPDVPEQQIESEPKSLSKRSFTDWLTESVSGTNEEPAVIAKLPTTSALTPATSKEEARQVVGRSLPSNTALTSETPAQTATPVTSGSAVGKAGIGLSKPLGQPDQKELLERFIQQDNPAPLKKTEFFTPQQAAKRSLDDSGGLVSETLAKIYVAQGNIAKGIDAYRRLGLKHPEKSAYFAALQKELEEQLNK